MHSLVSIAGFDLALWRLNISPEFQTPVLVGCLFLVILLIFLAAIFWRLPVGHKHIHGRHRVSHHVPVTRLPERRKRRPALLRLLRPRYRRQRLSNPTLAHTGGLPPQSNERPPAT